MTGHLRTDLTMVFISSGVLTTVLVVLLRFGWRRGKRIQEP